MIKLHIGLNGYFRLINAPVCCRLKYFVNGAGDERSGAKQMTNNNSFENSSTAAQTIGELRKHAAGFRQKWAKNDGVLDTGLGDARHHFSYTPCAGLTCIMRTKENGIDSIFNHFFESISKISGLISSVLLLPSLSYHVTLCGLEALLKTKIEDDALVEVLLLVEQKLRSLDWEQPLFQIDFSKNEVWRSAAILQLFHSSPSFKMALEHVQQLLCSYLGIESTAQQFHLTVGYYVTDNIKARRNAQLEILNAAKQIFNCVGYSISVEQPRICYYRSMEHFTPLF